MRILNQDCKPLALITGATGGIGSELSSIMKNNGFDLILVGKNPDKLKALGKKLDCDTVTADLSTHQGIDTVLSEIDKHPITHLINNAGFGICGKLTDNEGDEINSLLNVQVTAPTLFSHKFLSKSQSRSLVNISSVAGFSPDPFMCVYGSSKSYLNSFSQSIRYEYPDKSIILICPGPVKTQFDEKSGVTIQRKAMSPRKCAIKIFKSIRKGKSCVRFTSALSASCFIAMKFLPSHIMIRITARIQKRKIRK